MDAEDGQTDMALLHQHMALQKWQTPWPQL